MTATIPVAPIPHQERVKIIRERLRKLRMRERFTPLPKSKRVLAAEKVVEEWEERNEWAENAHYEKHRAQVCEVENALILGDMVKVVELLTKLETGR